MAQAAVNAVKKRRLNPDRGGPLFKVTVGKPVPVCDVEKDDGALQENKSDTDTDNSMDDPDVDALQENKCDTDTDNSMDDADDDALQEAKADTNTDNSDNDPDYRFQSEASEESSTSHVSCSVDSDSETIEMPSLQQYQDNMNVGTKGPSRSAYPNVKVPIHTRGKRAYDKRQACFFCHKLFAKIEEHWISQHKDEDEVKELQSANSSCRIEFRNRLCRLGNFNHNLRVLKKKEGVLMVRRRPATFKIAEEYIPCTACYEFVFERELWRHRKTCDVALIMEEDECKSLKRDSQSMLVSAICDNLFLTTELDQVLSKMVRDDVFLVLRNDELLMRFGAMEIKNLGPDRRNDIASRMRQVARLLLKIRESKPNLTVFDILKGENFDLTVRATASLCGNSDHLTLRGVHAMKSPSFGLQVGHSLKRLAIIKEGMALRLGDNIMLKDVENFERLRRNEWFDSIGCTALQTLRDRKYRFRSVDVLPLAADIKRISDYAEENIREKTNLQRLSPTLETWKELSSLVYTALTIFNFRRAGEVSKMKVESFTEAFKPPEDPGLLQTLTPLERKLSESLRTLYLPGKNQKRLPLLLRNSHHAAMQVLFDTRETCGVSSAYFFARKNRHLLGWNVLKDIAQKANCSHPEFISSTRLRKYAATSAQLLNLKEGELQWLAGHLGHSVDIHRDVYRLQEDTVERAKIAKLLILAEQGRLSECLGKGLQALDEVLEEVENVLPVEEKDDEHEDLMQSQDPNSQQTGEEGDHPASPVYDATDSLVDIADSSERVDPDVSVPTRKRSSNGKRNPWTSDEVECVSETFKSHIQEKRIPTTIEVKEFLQNCPTIKKRNLANIKSRVQYLIKKDVC